MRWTDQGSGGGRYAVIPRSLCFLVHSDAILLLRGAPTKRLWANKLNGIGGHIEPGETPLEGARREIREECGIEPPDLELRGIVHVCPSQQGNGIMLFVYVGFALSRAVHSGAEGNLEWHPLLALPVNELVEDLPELIPRVLTAWDGEIVYGMYEPDGDERMVFHFTQDGDAW